MKCSMKKEIIPPSVAGEQCIGCRRCVEVCPSFVLEMINDVAVVVRGLWCIGCGHCAAVCPTDAVTHERLEEMVPSEPLVPTIPPDRLLELLRGRRSVRMYRTDPVPRSLVDQILEAGRYAPTGRNTQNVQYVVFQRPEEINNLRERTLGFYGKIFSWVRNPIGALLLRIYAGKRMVKYLRESLPKVDHAAQLIERGEDRLFYHAPLVIVVHAESWDSCSAFNCATALYNCSLMAHTMGLGCCFNGYLESAVNHDRGIRRWLDIPHTHRCFGAMTVGYRGVEYRRFVSRNPPQVVWR